MDQKTEQIAADLIARFDAAMAAGDLAAAMEIADAASRTPNNPLQDAILRRLA
ncbi:MAG TPA: hypothetical protein VIZ86_16635 [Pseudomonas sp.]